MKIACIDYNMYKSDSKSWTDQLLARGVSCIEPALSSLFKEGSDPDAVITYALSRGMTMNLHAPFGVNNITSTDPVVRADSIANVKRSIDLSAKYGAGTVVFHPGRMKEEADDPEVIWTDLLAVVAELAQYAREKKVYLAIENMELRPYELVYTIEDLNRFAPIGQNNPYFGVTVDFAHYASHGMGLPDLKALKLPLLDVHLSQNNGKMHSALRSGGDPDVGAVCRLLADYGYDGIITLEVTDGVWESVALLADELKKLEM